MVIPVWPDGKTWDFTDMTKLLTAITFAGLGGFWTLFYSYWLKEKGAGMASHMPYAAGWKGHQIERIPAEGFEMNPSRENAANWKQWKRFLKIDSSVGIIGNIFTTLMTCLLAYALLFPKGIYPDEYQIAVVQSRFFEVGWGLLGKMIFLIVAALFLADTWFATADAVSRIYTDCMYQFFPKSRKWPVKTWYYIFILGLTLITSVTMPLAQPGPLILLSAVIGFMGTVLFTGMLVYMNKKLVPKMVPDFAKPSAFSFYAISLSWTVYIVLAVLFLYFRFFREA